MTTYTFNSVSGVITKDDGSIIPADDTLTSYQDYVAWLNEGNSPTLIDEEETPTYGRRITVLAFRNRFTHNEKITIEMASIDNPEAAQQLRLLAASLRVHQKDLDNATYVDLDRPDTISGVQAMETYGIIAAGRTDVIINSPVLQIEEPRVSTLLTTP